MSNGVFTTRAGLGEVLSTEALPAGLAGSSTPGEGLVPIATDELETLAALSRDTLAAAGISPGDRVLVTLHADGDLAATGLLRALAVLGATGTLADPRGRMRVLALMRTLRPRIWITTPQGAMDLLARLYLEFNVDPTELELERILLVGEIASPGVHRRLADEFESEVVDLYCDPFFGAALAQGGSGRFEVTDPALLGCASIGKDEILTRAPGERGEGLAELVVRPGFSAALGDRTLRTGQVVGGEGEGLFQHTIGEHVLARGRWVSLPALRAALSRIDGTVAWRLEVERGDGTLDAVRVVIGFDRPTLVENRMWAGRATQAVASVTPITFALEAELVEDAGDAGRALGEVADERGHHIASDRAAWAAAIGSDR